MTRGDAPHAASAAWSLEATPDWAKGVSLPEWLALREGAKPIVVVAPHGGRRLRPIRRGDSVNDLETAGIAWELASRLDAHAIVNHSLDRNEIDLNRITHLAARAPFVLSLLCGAIEAASSGGAVPIVLFVHGWNMVVPCCDIGIGLRRRAGKITGAYPTLSRARFDATIAAIERELAARGVTASVGRRYTASGRDNAAQLFSGRHAGHENVEVAALARLAREGGVDAAQLELGIPLRWKGPRRDALLDGLVAALGREPELGSVPRTRSDWKLEARDHLESTEPAEAAYALQAVLDEDSGLATFCGVESTGPYSMAARFSLVFTDGSMMLLVGEGEWSGERGCYHLEGFDWRTTDGGKRTEIRLRAPMIRYRTHDAYLDLEQGLADSSLEDAAVDLVAEAFSSERARLRGTVTTLGRTWTIDTVAFLDRAGRRMSVPESRIRVLSAGRNGETLMVRSVTGPAATLRMEDDSALGVIRAVAAGADPLRHAEVLARVPVWRPLGQGAFVRWQFGIVRCCYGDAFPETIGLFECTDVFGLPQERTSGDELDAHERE